ncbi:MAG: DivIVA domain-containing protein [Bacilli bacterium]
MNSKQKLTSEDILNTEFTKNVKGYDPLEVDKFLDEVILNYADLEKKNSEQDARIKQLQHLLDYKKDECSKLQVENVRMKNRLDKIEPTRNVTSDNLELLKRIDALEKVLYKLGQDPSKIK